MKQANHGGIRGESMEDSQSALVDTECSMTPSRQRRQLQRAVGVEEEEIDSEDHLTQNDDTDDLTHQQDVTVRSYFVVFISIRNVHVSNYVHFDLVSVTNNWFGMGGRNCNIVALMALLILYFFYIHIWSLTSVTKFMCILPFMCYHRLCNTSITVT